MALSVGIIRAAQKVLGDGPLARILARAGVARLVRWPRDRALLKRGVHEVQLLEKPARFAVTSRTQIEHIDALWREETMLQRIVEACGDDSIPESVVHVMSLPSPSPYTVRSTWVGLSLRRRAMGSPSGP